MNGNPPLGWSAGLFGMAVCAGLIAAGAYLVRTPTERLLRGDVRTGRWIYERELRLSGDEQRAIEAVGRFYKALGYCFVIMASGHFLLSLYFFISGLIAN
jgi:hypothetical protein